MVSDMDFALCLRDLRKESKQTTRELASLAGISNASISQFENGKRKPSVQILKKLSKALSDGNLLEERNIYTMFLNLTGHEEELSKVNSYIDELESQVILSRLIPLEDGMVNGFSLNGKPIHLDEQRVLNAFVEHIKIARSRLKGNM